MQMLTRFQCVSSKPSVSMARMSSTATTQTRLDAAPLVSEVAALRCENEQLRSLLSEAMAELVQLRAQLHTSHEQLQSIEDERAQTHQTLTDLKRRPFTRRAAHSEATKPRGRAVGHVGSGRSRPTRIDATEHIPAGEQCPDCGSDFTGKGVTRERVVEDIVLVRPTRITKFLIERRWCPSCRCYHENAVTDALPRHRLGLHVLLFVVYQKVALGLSYAKIHHELLTYFGLKVSVGELPQMVAEVSSLFGPAYARLLELMRLQAALHIDETSWRVDGVGHWLWVFVNDVVALYVVSRSRGSKVPQALLGPDFDGTVISDFFSAYSPLEVEKAKCWSHLLSESHTHAKGCDKEDERARFHQRLHALFLEMGLAIEQVEADPTERERIADELRDKLWRFASEDWRSWQCVQLAKRIIKYLDDLVVWLYDSNVEPTNNAAERALRGAVVTRKTSFGSRSKRGAQAFARLLSIITSFKLQGKDFFSTAYQALSDPCSQN